MISQPFQVDLRGVVDLLSRHVYSSPQVYLRELIQNGRDAIVARRLADPDAPAGEIRISGGAKLVISDNGIGLTAAEAADLLATVGRSSKRDELFDLRRDDYLGQFGIGLLSGFMIADEIQVTSRSISNAPAIEWVGVSDGTFTIRELSPAETAATPIGTRVCLTARPDEVELTRSGRVRELATKYAQYLTETILIDNNDGTWDTINQEPIFAGTGKLTERSDEVLEYAQAIIGAEPLAIIQINVPETQTTGLAFVFPFQSPGNVRQSHQVYLGRMLLNERVDDILPDWAFFVRCVLNTDGLSPTAAREQLIENEALAYTREQIGATLRQWLLDVAADLPPFFNEFLRVHHVALKAMALADLELAQVLIPLLSADTSIGTVTYAELIGRYSQLRFTETVDEFRQISAVASPDEPVINGGYTFETELISRIPQIAPGVGVARVKVHEILDELASPALVEREAAFHLEARAAQVLSDVEVVTRLFRPENVAALYLVDPAVLARLERHHARKQAPPIWAQILDEVEELVGAEESETSRRPKLCLNWGNPLIQQLVAVADDLVFDRSVKLIYVQALLDGHHRLRAQDRAMLTSAMSDLIQLSVGFGGFDSPGDI